MSNLTTRISSNPERLKQYLKDIYNVEKELYCASTAVAELNRKIDQVKREPVEYKETAPTPPVSPFTAGVTAATIAVIPAAIFIFVVEFFELFDLDIIGSFIEWPLYSILYALGIGTVVAIITALIHPIFNTRYKAELAKYNKDAQTYTLEKKSSQNALIANYQQLRTEYESCVLHCRKTLDTLYDCDVIFPKYRNLIAVAQFYEYMMSGRCSILEGHEGAYNIYENEIRQEIIITKLDEAINLLKEIRDTQYLLLEALHACNDRLKSIESLAAATEANTAAIAYNTAAIARNMN